MTGEGATVADRLTRLSELAEQAGATDVARDLAEAVDRLREGLLFLACVGQFKRGKSSLVNALIGEPLLPTGVAPVTSVATIVRSGPPGARVRIGDRWQPVELAHLDDFVSESKNPENTKRVEAVEVTCRSELLSRGVCLVDTPGLGSVFAGNTEATRAFLPRIDAALVVLGADPPITGEELALVQELSRRVDTVMLVLNKADRLDRTDLDEASSFIRIVVRERAPEIEPTPFEVSAAERIAGRATRDWDALVRRIEALAGTGEGRLVGQAAARRTRDLAQRLAAHVREQRNALSRPVEESRARIEALRRCAIEAEASLGDLQTVLDGEQRRLERDIDAELRAFVTAALPKVVHEIDGALAVLGVAANLRVAAIDVAQRVTEPTVRAWLEQERPVVERRFAEASARLATHANQYLARIRASAAPDTILPAVVAPEAGLRARSRFFYRSFQRLATTSLIDRVGDAFRGREATRRAARDAAIVYARRTLEANSNAVAGDLIERIVESRRSVEARMGRTLADSVAVASAALEAAEAKRAEGAGAVARAIAIADECLEQIAACGS